MKLMLGARAGLVVAALGTALTAVATGATAASTYPAPPSGAHVSAIGTTSFTVTSNRVANVRLYKVFVSRLKADLYVDSLAHWRSTRRTFASATPTVGASGLAYATGTYYWRYATTTSTHLRVSGIGTVHLRPTAPAIWATVESAGAFISISGGAVSGYEIAQSTNAAMTAGRRVYTTRHKMNRFTPFSLTPGRRYYFRVRGLNGPTASGWSNQAVAVPVTRMQSVKVTTYNLLSRSFDGTQHSGEVIAPWDTERRPAAIALLKAEAPDVIGLQEAAATDQLTGLRQVDDILQGLGPTYSPFGIGDGPVHGGSYLIYRNTTFEREWNGAFTLGDQTYAAYAILHHLTTGARFLAVVTHLPAGSEPSYDEIRAREMTVLVSKSRAIAAENGSIPIIYLGDLNATTTGSYHKVDTVGATMNSLHIPESYLSAQWMTNSAYNSNNVYRRTPPRGLGSIDRLFAEPGVALTSWRELMRLTGAGTFAGVIPSDHNPVATTIAVPY